MDQRNLEDGQKERTNNKRRAYLPRLAPDPVTTLAGGVFSPTFMQLPFPLPELPLPPELPLTDPSRPSLKPEFLPSDPVHPLSRLVEEWTVTGAGRNISDYLLRRRQRRFLDAHFELLAPGSDGILQEMMAKKAADEEWVRILQEELHVLHQARAGGGTIQAVRRAYVNVHGGLTLDIPEWLEAMVEQVIVALKWDDHRTAAQRIALLRAGFAAVQADPAIPEEVRANLYHRLGMALRSDEGATNQADALEEAIAAYHEALQIYTQDSYPEQYAAIQHDLGNIYMQRLKGSRSENLNQAIQCYEAALRIFTRDEYPKVWASCHGGLGIVYSLRRDNRTRDLELALQHMRATLQVVAADTFARIWGNVQGNMAALYLERIDGDLSQNIERAMQCLKAALRYFTREEHLDQWAWVQNLLGMAYLRRIDGEHARNIECALRCFQAVARVVTEETLPRDWIDAQQSLGNAYRRRIQGEATENIELAIEHLSAALQAIEQHRDALQQADARDIFSIRWMKAHNDLGEAYRQRVYGKRVENLRQAHRHHQAVFSRMPPDFPEWQRATLNLAFIAALPR